MAFEDVIVAINGLGDSGLIQGYAVAGAVAQGFWDEPIQTRDLDVLVLLGSVANELAPLAKIYEWARDRGYREELEHVWIAGVPVQFMPVPDGLEMEAVQTAVDKPFGGSGMMIKVVRPEYLIALWLKPPANTHGRKERAARLRESGAVDETALRDLMKRYGLSW
jgi:hypothetical protein